jgi:hypothetical protein
MGMDRRSFFRSLGAAATLAPAVKLAATLPDVNPEKFAVGNRPPFQMAAGWRAPTLDVRDGVLYDRIRFKAGSRLPAHVRFFCCPIGQTCYYSGALKTERHTNMQSAGQLNAPSEFLAYRVLFAVHPSASQADIDAVSSECFWAFQLLQKWVMSGPMLLNGPARAGLRDVVTRDGLPVDPLPGEVLATAHNNTLDHGLYIPSLYSFCLKIETPENQVVLASAVEGGRGLDLLVALHGVHAWGVQ